MNLQERTLRQYLHVKKHPSLRRIARETGIQQTRVFRLLNGARMRLDEWEVFNQAIVDEMADLERLARECVSELSLDQLSELRHQMTTKLSWKRSIDEVHDRLQQA